MVYGDKFDKLFSPIVPVPLERIIMKKHKETLNISTHTTLTFYDTPGHSRHHFSIYDPISNGIFTGDTAGIQYEYQDQYFYLPSTSPNHFDPEAMKSSMNLYSSLNVDRIYFGHYGMSEDVEYALTESRNWLDVFIEESQALFVFSDGFENNTKRISSRLYHLVESEWIRAGVHSTSDILIHVKLDIEVSAMGLVDFLYKQQA